MKDYVKVNINILRTTARLGGLATLLSNLVD